MLRIVLQETKTSLFLLALLIWFPVCGWRHPMGMEDSTEAVYVLSWPRGYLEMI